MIRKLIRAAIVLVGIALVLAAAAGGLLYAFTQHFNFTAPKAEYPKPESPLEAQRQDLDYFRILMEFDRSFAPDTRREAERRISQLRALPVALPEPQLHILLMQIMALADNGHTRMRVNIQGKATPMLPVRVAPFTDGFFVMRAKKPFADMLGGRLESIDGMPFEAVLKKLETLRGGTEPFRRYNAAIFVADQDLLYGLGIAGSPVQSTWAVRRADGTIVTHVLTAEPEKDEPQSPSGPRWRSPAPVKSMGAGWVAAAPARGTVPLSEQDMDTIFFRATVPNTCAEYLRMEAIVDTKGQKIQPYLGDREAALQAHAPCAVILDLRGNGGGDYTNMWHFTHTLPDLVKPGGHIYVLTDAGTFSAAITTTAFTKEAGGNRTIIIGEPVGDRLAFYAEGNSGVLPNSRFSLGFETGKHDYAHSCYDWHDCFWLDWIYPVRVKTLEPDIAAPETFADWNRGHDIAYDDAVAEIGRNDLHR